MFTARVIGGIGWVQLAGVISLLPPFLVRDFALSESNSAATVFVGMWNSPEFIPFGHLKLVLDSSASNTDRCVWDPVLGSLPGLCPVLGRVMLVCICSLWVGSWARDSFSHTMTLGRIAVYLPLVLMLACLALYIRLTLYHLRTNPVHSDQTRRMYELMGAAGAHFSVTCFLALIWLICPKNYRGFFGVLGRLCWWSAWMHAAIRFIHHSLHMLLDADNLSSQRAAARASGASPSSPANRTPTGDIGCPGCGLDRVEAGQRLGIIGLDFYVLLQLLSTGVFGHGGIPHLVAPMLLSFAAIAWLILHHVVSAAGWVWSAFERQCLTAGSGPLAQAVVVSGEAGGRFGGSLSMDQQL